MDFIVRLSSFVAQWQMLSGIDVPQMVWVITTFMGFLVLSY